MKRSLDIELAAVRPKVLALARKFFRASGLAGDPEDVVPEPDDTMELLQKLQFISNLDPADADGYEFKRVGDGFIMTAHFQDGREASFILTPMEGGQSFYLVSLND